MSAPVQDPELLARLTRPGLVPVVVIDDARAAGSLGDALVAGGLPVAEVTLRTAAGVESLRRLADRGDLLVGAGTVLTPDQVDEAVGAGAGFVVSPGLSRPVVERCLDLGVLVLPGAVTASEIQSALELGLTTVKFFPAESSGGVAAVQALSAPFGAVSFLPTGGIGPANLADYLSLPAVRAVGGSWMVPRESIGDTARLSVLVEQAARLASQLRPAGPASGRSGQRRPDERSMTGRVQVTAS